MKQHSFASNFASLFSSNILKLVLGIITSMIMARWLAPEGMGIKAILTNFPILFVSLFEMGVRQSTVYFLGTKKYEENQLFSTILTLWLSSSIIGLIVYGILSYIKFDGIAASLILVSATYIPIYIGQAFLSGLLLGKNLIKKLAIFNIANAILTPIATIVLLVIFDMGVMGVLIATQGVALYTLGYRILLLKKELKLKFHFTLDIQVITDLLTQGVFYAIALFLTSNMRLIPIFLMTGVISKYEIGIYSAGVAFAFLLTQLVNSTFPILFAKGATATNHIEHSKKVQVLLRVLMPILSTGVLLVLFVLPYIIPLMYGDKYEDSIPITRIMLIGIYAYTLQTLLIMDMAGKGKPLVTIKAVAPAFVLCLVFNYFGIEALGNMGAAISTSAAMVICSISYFWVYSKETRTPIKEILKPRKSDWVIFYAQLKGLKK